MRLWLTALLLSILILAGLSSEPAGIRQSGSFSTDPATVYTHYFPQRAAHGNVLVIHGLGASKEVMNMLCLALSDAGFHVYSIDLPGHGDSPAGFNAMEARHAVQGALESLGPDTIAIGHSLGGTLLLDLAVDHTFRSIVLLSPAPTPIDLIRADRMLVITGQFELPRIQAFVPQLEITGSEGVELRIIPWSGHSGYLFQPEAIRDIVAWLGGDASSVQTGRRLFLLLLEILSVVTIAALWLRGKPVVAERIHLPTRIVAYIASSAVALLISGVVVVLNGLHLFSADYLISFTLLTGVALTPLYFRRIPGAFSQIHAGLFVSACVIAAAVFVGSGLAHLRLSGGRWWQFAAITLAGLPLAFADEILLRPLRPWWKAAGAMVLTRILIAAFVITGVLTMNRDDAFLVLVIHFTVLFWVVLWFAGELFRRRIPAPLATAVFIALIQGWMFAAIFVRS